MARRLVIPKGTRGSPRWEPMIRVKEPHEIVEREDVEHAFIEEFRPKESLAFTSREKAIRAYDEAAASGPPSVARLQRQVEALAAQLFNRPVATVQPSPAGGADGNGTKAGPVEGLQDT